MNTFHISKARIMAVAMTGAVFLSFSVQALAITNGDGLSFAPMLANNSGSSTNWAGYVAQAPLLDTRTNSVSDVKGSWKVPSVTCGPIEKSSATWVGIDGYGNSTAQQIGTAQNCVDGVAEYYAWFQ